MSTPDNQDLTILKLRADNLGLTYSNNIGYETLEQRVLEAEQALSEKSAQEATTAPKKENLSTEPTEEELAAELAANMKAYEEAQKEHEEAKKNTQNPTNRSIYQKLRMDAMALKRCKIQMLNPAKQNMEGEIICVANEFIGNVKVYVPWSKGALTDGWHLPTCIYENLKQRKYTQVDVKKGANGRDYYEHRDVPEFSLIDLPPLTKEELAKLAAKQAAAGGLDD